MLAIHICIEVNTENIAQYIWLAHNRCLVTYVGTHALP
jgi:hypothetical protein